MSVEASGTRRAARAALALALAGCAGAAARGAGNPATEIESPMVEVVGLTPVPGLGTPLRDVPSAVQSFDGEAMRRRGAMDAAEYMERSFAGVSANGSQSNAFQPDLQFRGFAGSPLLGLPQGISVFVDGVRVNEAFGDVVNWDLIPRNAISTSHLISGVNPVFGLNTLGGAVSIISKSGFSFPGQSARLQLGAFGRTSAEFESGAHGEHSDYFAAGHALDERGWREHSSSSLRQLFAKAGWQDAVTDLDVSMSLAHDTLRGTQALPRSMLDSPRKAYTWPDLTRNELRFATVRGSQYLRDDLLLAGFAYYRGLRQDGLGSNVNEDYDVAQPAGPGNAQAFNDRHALRQRTSGASLQLTHERKAFGGRSQLTLGASYDRAKADFAQDRQRALLSPDRETIGFGDFDAATRVRAGNDYLSAYAAAHFAPRSDWTLAFFGRYNAVKVRIEDRSGAQSALNGTHRFSRFNPGIGANYNPTPRVTWFASAGQAMRVPSPMELTCADPAAPCTLPNQFLADPPLKPVVARTLEAGLRARPADALQFSAAVYRSVLRDDIQFVSSGGALNAGFFQNVGRTLREGLELAAAATVGRVQLDGSFGAVRASYLSAFAEHSPANSSRDANGDILVTAGSRLPGIARRQFKLHADWRASGRASLGLGWAWFDRQYARGDENNRDANGALPAYHIAYATARYAPSPNWELALKIDNLFNRSAANFGVLGQNFFAGPGRSFDPDARLAEQFRAPVAPRAIWLSLRYELSGGGTRL